MVRSGVFHVLLLTLKVPCYIIRTKQQKTFIGVWVIWSAFRFSGFLITSKKWGTYASPALSKNLGSATPGGYACGYQSLTSWYRPIQYFPPDLSTWRRCWHKWKQDAQLSQRDRAAGYISFGRKWKTGTQRQYFTGIVSLASTTVT